MSIYQEIVKTIAKDIQNGNLEKGNKLPSIRQISQTYGCSKDTAQRALWNLSIKTIFMPSPKVAIMFSRGPL